MSEALFEQMRQELLAWTGTPGMTPSVLLELNEPLRSALKRIMRRGTATLADLSHDLGLERSEAEAIAELLVACGLLQPRASTAAGERVYGLRRAPVHRARTSISAWDVLLEPETSPDEEGD